MGIAAVMTLVALEGMAAATVMPVVVHALDGVTLFSWTYNAWVASSLVAMVVAGRFADRLGPVRPLAAGVTAFAAGALVAALAPSMPVFIVGRAVQGLGGGAWIVAAYVLIARAYPEPLRPKVFTLFSASWVVPSLAGPVIAGWLAENTTWRLVFALVPVLVLPALAILVRSLRGLGGADSGSGQAEDPRLGARRLRWAVAAAGGLVAFQQGLLERTPAWLVVSAVGLAVVLRAALVLLPRGTLRMRRGLPAIVAMRALVSGSYFAGEAFVALALTSVRHLSVTTAGLVLSAGAVSWAIGSYIQGHSAAPRVRLARIGVASGLVSMLGLPLSMWSPWPAPTAALFLFAGAFGMGLFFPSQGVLLLSISPPEDQGRNSASLQVSDSMGGVVLLSVTGAVQAGAAGSGGAGAATFATIWWVLAGVLLLANLSVGRMQPVAAEPVAEG